MLELAPGRHTIEMHLDWARSAPLALTLADGAAMNLVCGPNYSAATALVAFFRPSQWIYVEREEVRARRTDDAGSRPGGTSVKRSRQLPD